MNTLNTTTSINIDESAWSAVRHQINEISIARVRQGFTSTETASFIFSLKEPLFSFLRKELGDQPQLLSEEIALTSSLFDRLGLLSIDSYQKSREQVIARQQQELLELSTPVVQLWQNIIALPLIGTLDSARTQVVMENLLQKVVETGAAIAIIDITGVPTVDTLVAQHLLKTISATRLMGADCIINGIRPQIAQTIVHQLRTLPEMNHALLVALTGYGQAHHRQEALNAGFNQHFAKPVDFEKLGLLGLYV